MMSDCACLVCRTHLVVAMLAMCDDCGCWICPACDTHGKVFPFVVMDVPPSHVASVTASVWGRAN